MKIYHILIYYALIQLRLNTGKRWLPKQISNPWLTESSLRKVTMFFAVGRHGSQHAKNIHILTSFSAWVQNPPLQFTNSMTLSMLLNPIFKEYEILWGLNELIHQKPFSHLQKEVVGLDQCFQIIAGFSRSSQAAFTGGKRNGVHTDSGCRVPCGWPALSLLPPSPMHPEQLFFCLLYRFGLCKPLLWKILSA